MQWLKKDVIGRSKLDFKKNHWIIGFQMNYKDY